MLPAAAAVHSCLKLSLGKAAAAVLAENHPLLQYKQLNQAVLQSKQLDHAQITCILQNKLLLQSNNHIMREVMRVVLGRATFRRARNSQNKQLLIRQNLQLP